MSATIEEANAATKKRPPAIVTKILVGLAVIAAGIFVGRMALGLFSPHLYAGTVFQAATPAPDMGDLMLDTGESAALGQFEDEVVLVYFGYTHCPDVCPTTLSDAAKAIDGLGGDSDRVQLLMVTIDPDRDELAPTGEYVRFFDETFMGVGGDPDEIADVATRFGVFYEAGEVAEDGSYDLDHTASLMGIDTDGNLRIVWPPGVDSDALSADLAELLK